MFKREHHVRIATLLQALDADTLADHGCLFGGGTAIVLSRAEYRESLDVDFLVSDSAGYRALRHAITGKRGLDAITRPGMKMECAREVRADQYGIRTMLWVARAEIKLEIIFEGRVSLDPPDLLDPERRICGVCMLTALDMAATKLMANSDRGMDDSVFSRDLIDLAMLEPSQPLLARAIEKASAAYGESITRDLAKAIQRLKDRPGRLDECMSALQMDAIPKALLWKRIRRVGARLA